MTYEDRIYLRPYGFVDSADAGRVIEDGLAMPLAGGPKAFTLLEVIRRTATGLIRRRVVRVGDIDAVQRLIGEGGLSDLTDARSPLLGFTFAEPVIMGVVNATPDSFSDGGKFVDPAKAIQAAKDMQAQGAHIIDVGGESTRPGADEVTSSQELERVLPIIEGLSGEEGMRLSIDSRKADVLEAANTAGAHMLNDVSALSYDARSMEVAAKSDAPIILMHAQGTPQTMQDQPNYHDVLLDVYDYLHARIQACQDAGISKDRLIVDPGIGFGKTVQHNIALLSGLSLFHGLGCPVLLGASRKSFIGTLDQGAPTDQRLPGSLSAIQAGLTQGVQLFRVHDVPETRQFLAVSGAILGNRSKD